MSTSQYTPLKQCTSCEKWLPKTNQYFGRHCTGKDGLRPTCKDCTNSRNKAYKKTEAGKIAERRYSNGDAGKKTRKGISDRYASKNRDKRLAKATVQQAIRHGKLLPVSGCKCAKCGKQAEHYHHWSYERQHWLDVVPVCAKCHTAIHMARNTK